MGAWIEPPRAPVASTAPAQAARPGARHAPPPVFSNEGVKTGGGTDLSSETPAALTGAAATAELRKDGHYQALGAALAAARRAVEKIDPAGPQSRGTAFFAANPGQQLRAWFSRDGVELASGVASPSGREPWSVTLRLSGVGRAKSVGPVRGGRVSGEGQRVEVSYPAAALTQWFENRREGVEQGFTLHQPPEGGAGDAMIVLDVGGTLHAEAMDGQEGVRLADASGADVLRYAGLKAWDASGHGLLARMELRGSGLALVVADAGASYPVTIDPLFANVEARLTEDAIAGDNFGSSVALAGDTALVGAPYDTTTAGFRAGSAYLFVRSGTVWDQQARLTAPDGAVQDRFGWAVALAGGTALVGASGDDTEAATDAGSA